MHYIPSFAKLRKSFRRRGGEFLRENTLHGFSYFVDTSRPLYERVFWIGCTLASFCGAVASIVVILRKFRNQPILTVVTVPPAPLHEEFPTVVLCMDSEHLDLPSPLADDPEILENFLSLYNWKWKHIAIHENILKIEESVMNLQKTFFKSTPGCDSLLADCQLLGVRGCAELFEKLVLPTGVCCATRPSGNRTTGVLKFSLQSTKTMRLYLSPAAVHPNRESPVTYELNRNLGFSLSLAVTTSEAETKLYSPSVRGCATADESPPQDICYRNCQKRVIMEKLKCLPWWLNGDDAAANCRLHEYNELLVYRAEVTDGCFNGCPLGCENLWFGIDKIYPSDKTRVEFMKQPLIRYQREVTFGLLELLVSFGGIMGLFLGYSVLTTVEFLYYFTLRTYCGAVIEKEELSTLAFRVVKPAEARRSRSPKALPYDFYVN